MNGGDVVGDRYVVRRALEVGPHSVLLEALDLSTEAFVLIEQFRRLPAAFVARLLADARTQSRLSTEHVVRVLGGEAGRRGACYVVSELPEGESLEAIVRRKGPVPASHAAELMLQVCSALDEAHGVGLVGWAISPERLLLRRFADGAAQLQIRDYGGRRLEAALAQRRGELVVLDVQADILELGATLYELSSGRRPFVRRLEALTAPGAAGPVPLSDLCGHLPLRYATAVMRCFAGSEGSHYTSVAELAEALAAFSPSRTRLASAVRGVLSAGASRLRASSSRMQDLVRARRS